ncbi:putative sterigmatocystin biosynthesis fatty acid synthase subunit beta [Aspergillus nidulans var. acristatus]
MAPSPFLDAVDAGRSRLYACFGGQGPSNWTGLDELVHLSHAYADCAPIQHLIDSSARRLESLAAIPHRSSFFVGRGFQLQAWLNDAAASTPLPDDLALSPYSFPINTLLSLVHYAITAYSLQLDPAQLRQRLQGAIGHSQGVFVAAAIAISHADHGWPSFYRAADLALQLSFWVGLESHHASPASILCANEVTDCLENGEGAPSHLLSVAGLDMHHLEQLVRKLNDQGGDSTYISLINGHNKFVLAGAPHALRRVCIALRSVKASPKLDQSRVPFPLRRPVIEVQFLPVSAPYHSSLLSSVELRVTNAIGGLRLKGNDLSIPVYCQMNGSLRNLQDYGSHDVLLTLIRAVTVEQVNWLGLCHKMNEATHVLSFGPGAVGSLVQDVLEGTGVDVINLSGRSMASNLSSLGLSALALPLGQNWGRRYCPRLRKVAEGTARPYIETKMTRLLGAPHVMVAGMTPTTCSPELVAAIIQAGYHVEFACGGYHDRTTLETALRQLARSIPVHRSITCNVIYASPKSLSWQIQVLRRLITEEGLPIDGLTVGAGIPSPEVVKEWIDTLALSHIWFKPGSVDAIDRVLTIARQYPSLPIGLQWTGGRAGGHHSCEDFHLPILDCYARIRGCENVILVAGSGFGGAEDTWPYVTGTWSCELGYAPMPFDGILLGSRIMVAREARTSLAAKQLIVDAPGINDDGNDNGAWTECERNALGGVISVTSEMGQPIHVLANRGMRLWKEFDGRFFSIRDPERLKAALKQHRDEIISRLNNDFARPWFAQTDSGKPTEIGQLSYRQVLRRLCQLTYVQHQARWIDASYLSLVHDFLRLAQGRLGSGLKAGSCLLSCNSPRELQASFDKAYGVEGNQTLHPEDVSLLINLFRRQGQKPVPFIPQLDADFQTWFKKDSLWQSEDVDAVVDQDAQRVCIIQGPVAVRHSRVCDEPVKDILNGIAEAHVKLLVKETSNDNGYTSTNPRDERRSRLPGIETSQEGSLRRYHLVGPTLPSTETIVEHLVDECAWTHAALSQKKVVFGQNRARNPIRDAFKPDIGDVIEVKYVEGCLREITLYHSSRQRGDPRAIRAALGLIHLDSNEVSVTLLTRSKGKRPALEFKMELLGGAMGPSILKMHRINYFDSVRRLYTDMWIGRDLPSLTSVGLNSEFTGNRVTITAEDVNAFLALVGQAGSARCRAWGTRGPVVPIDYAVVIAWTALTKPILLEALDADPLRLLHQSASTRLVRGVRPLHVGDTVTTSSRITERTITATGQRVEISAEILRDGKPVVRLQTTFVIQRRPEQSASQQQFRTVDEPDMVMHVDSPVKLRVLMSRKWFLLDGPCSDLTGKTLIFRLHSQTVFDAAGGPASLQVSGSVSLAPSDPPVASALSVGTRIGRVYMEEEGFRVNPVMDFLNRHGAPRVQRQTLPRAGWAGDDAASISFTAPAQSEGYGMVSGDTNPIHVCPLFARFAGLGEPVVHGLHLSATVRRILEWIVGDNDRTRFCSWTPSFDGLVRVNDPLQMETKHRAMEDGYMVVHVRVLKESTGEQVMHAEAVLEQSQTTYVFTGQGTQERGMGMALYDTNAAARAVWDRAERHFRSQYGISLLHIVRDNPTSLTVNFGSRRGRQIRDNYLSMSGSDLSMLPGLTRDSRSYTFNYPSGLLMSTQFAQPALAVMEMAEYAHLQAQGVVQTQAPFAGHSLGEYSGLGACTTIMPFESLLSLILYRGLKMQNALPRDANGRTDYAMVAADPSRIRSDFTEDRLIELVRRVGQATGLLLEVVNYNVHSRQYVCAGHVRSLWVLGHVCDDLSRSTSPDSPQTMSECIARHITSSCSVTNETELTRGRATIPLAGVDIPFHSQMLRGHIDGYRQYLRHHLRVSDIKPEELVGRWIPNVVGRPFSLDAQYIRLVQGVTQSRPLLELLRRVEEMR